MNNLGKLLEAIDFAAQKHRHQKRKGIDGQPYINHPVAVANLLANLGGIDDFDILIAAILHDTIEDTETTAEEISANFGKNVSAIVLEVTDDKSLPKEKRKELQIEHAPHLSRGAKLVKLADKISNVSDIFNNSPDWSAKTKEQYVEWAKKVVDGLRCVSPHLENYFDNLVD